MKTLTKIFLIASAVLTSCSKPDLQKSYTPNYSNWHHAIRGNDFDYKQEASEIILTAKNKEYKPDNYIWTGKAITGLKPDTFYEIKIECESSNPETIRLFAFQEPNWDHRVYYPNLLSSKWKSDNQGNIGFCLVLESGGTIKVKSVTAHENSN